MNDPVIDKMADKYVLLTQFYCQVSGLLAWLNGSFCDGATKRDIIEALFRYKAEYESAVAKIEEVKSDH